MAGWWALDGRPSSGTDVCAAPANHVPLLGLRTLICNIGAPGQNSRSQTVLDSRFFPPNDKIDEIRAALLEIGTLEFSLLRLPHHLPHWAPCCLWTLALDTWRWWSCMPQSLTVEDPGVDSVSQLSVPFLSRGMFHGSSMIPFIASLCPSSFNSVRWDTQT